MPFLPLAKSLKGITATVLILSLVGCDLLSRLTTNSVEANTYSVKRVSDGDTLTATDTKGTDITVRFACIDAPEIPHSTREKQSRKAVDKDQFKWGVQAQQRVQQLVKQGSSRVKLTITDTDQYGRRVSEVRLPDNTLIQEVLAGEGLAMVYKPYLKNCPDAEVVQQAEANAKKAHRGIWGDFKFVPPWEYRHKSKSKQG